MIKLFEHIIPRAGFQMLTSTLDPSFTLSSDWYYRGLLGSELLFCIYLYFLYIIEYEENKYVNDEFPL